MNGEISRAGFLRSSVALAALAGLSSGFGADGEEVPPPKVDHVHVKPRNRHPYSGIDWSKAVQINTTSHMHETNALLDVVRKRNLGFLTISNYYPSAPLSYPLAKAVYPQGVPVSTHPVMVNGKMRKGPFDWNKIVREWADEIPEKDRQQWPPYPFKTVGKSYSTEKIPKGLLEAPNAEHHYFKLKDGKTADRLHLCAPGSAYASGTFDAHNRKRTVTHGYCSGSGEFWGTAIDRMIEGLVCPDGGGVTINHPTWSRLDRGLLLELLDWDPRVLGIEVLEAGHNSENYWDWALSTGRQCYGLFVPDWSVSGEKFGVNVLVVPERTPEACLRAYRNGNFYGAAHGLGELKFTSIELTASGARATTDKPARFEVITAHGVVQTTVGTSVSWTCPKDDGWGKGPRLEVFARIRATALDGCGETLYTQAGMLI